jgi:hypothetical protein
MFFWFIYFVTGLCLTPLWEYWIFGLGLGLLDWLADKQKVSA